ncbi:MAG TPA: hypothetical protein VI112_14860 [Bacteroidia bacterium]|jgi:hypothetical protein
MKKALLFFLVISGGSLFAQSSPLGSPNTGNQTGTKKDASVKVQNPNSGTQQQSPFFAPANNEQETKKDSVQTVNPLLNSSSKQKEKNPKQQ